MLNFQQMQVGTLADLRATFKHIVLNKLSQIAAQWARYPRSSPKFGSESELEAKPAELLKDDEHSSG